MPCTPFKLPDGSGGFVTGIVCTRRGRRARCAYCAAWHDRLCDFEVAPGKTCDRKLCLKHALRVGPDRDVCPDHVAKKPVDAPPCLFVFTGSVHRHRVDPDAFDVTRRTGGPAAVPFAPSEALFVRGKGEMKRAEQRELEARAVEVECAGRELSPAALALTADHRTAARRIEDDAWQSFRRGFLAEMLVSSGRKAPPGWERDVDLARMHGVVAHVEAWTALLHVSRRVLLCYEPGRERCHRGLLAEVLVRMGARDGGELPAAPTEQAALPFAPR